MESDITAKIVSLVSTVIPCYYLKAPLGTSEPYCVITDINSNFIRDSEGYYPNSVFNISLYGSDFDSIKTTMESIRAILIDPVQYSGLDIFGLRLLNSLDTGATPELAQVTEQYQIRTQ